jgi:D-alanyl-D-alanine carboxypeptidase
MMKKIRIVLLLVGFIGSVSVNAQKTVDNLRHVLDSMRIAGNFPGLSVSVVFANNERISLASGYNDREKKTLLKPSDRLMQGSVGKTYVSAIAMRLIHAKRINLDDKVSKYLGAHEWYGRIPNAEDITIRMIMNHTSGVMRYEFKEAFTKI